MGSSAVPEDLSTTGKNAAYGNELKLSPEQIRENVHRKKGRSVETSESNEQGRANAERGYELIMRNKTRLLSFDEPVRFIFSHSALKEGWDNPNVFQICTLNEVSSDIRRRWCWKGTGTSVSTLSLKPRGQRRLEKSATNRT